VPRYPLRLWRWDRQRCSTFLTQHFTLTKPWPRSCCTFCPFSATAGSRPELVARWRDQPSAGADALELEWTAMAVNPMIGAFGVADTAHDVAREHGLVRALAIATHRITSRRDWVLLEVRRCFTAKDENPQLKGFAWRSVAVIRTGTRKQMLAALRTIPNTELEIDQFGITRAWRLRRPGPDQPARYPMREWLYVAVPAGVHTKNALASKHNGKKPRACSDMTPTRVPQGSEFHRGRFDRVTARRGEPPPVAYRRR